VSSTIKGVSLIEWDADKEAVSTIFKNSVLKSLGVSGLRESDINITGVSDLFALRASYRMKAAKLQQISQNQLTDESEGSFTSIKSKKSVTAYSYVKAAYAVAASTFTSFICNQLSQPDFYMKKDDKDILAKVGVETSNTVRRDFDTIQSGLNEKQTNQHWTSSSTRSEPDAVKVTYAIRLHLADVHEGSDVVESSYEACKEHLSSSGTHSLCLSQTNKHSFSFFLTFDLSLCLSNSHTHTHTYIHTHSYTFTHIVSIRYWYVQLLATKPFSI